MSCGARDDAPSRPEFVKRADVLVLLNDLCGVVHGLLAQPSVQGERLLKPTDVAAVLGISRASVFRLLPKLRARGLKVVEIPAAFPKGGERRRRGRPESTKRYTASSLARLIVRAAENEQPLC